MMHKHGTNETLRFNGFSGSYGYIPNGYGGFNWEDMYYYNTNEDAARQGLGEGYQYPIDGRGEAALGPFGSGEVMSADPSESFTLRSMLADSGTSIGSPVLFTSYTYQNGVFAKKASDWMYITPEVQQIDFAKLGGKGDFRNVAAVFMLVGSHAYAMGYGHEAVGGGMVFDNLKVHWNGTIPGGHLEAGRGHSVLPGAHHPVAAHLWPGNTGETAVSGHEPAGPQLHSGSMLASLDAALGHADPHIALTEQFVLPQPEHFGT
jgi:hypothetical protein